MPPLLIEAMLALALPLPTRTMDREASVLLMPRILYALTLVLLLAACSGGGESDPPEPTPTADPYLGRLSEVVLARVQATSWYNDGDYGSAGSNVLEVITQRGPLWRDANSLELLEVYPDGIPDETLASARSYARMTLRGLDEVILDPWLVDGVDDYERAILGEASERSVSVSALRRALADGLFRPTYDSDPELLTSSRIDAVGSVSPHVLALLESKDWFSDGIDSYEASLLGVINSLLSVDEQLRLLESDNYHRLPLSTGDIAAVYVGDPERSARAQDVAAAWMEDIEAFVGEFRPVGLVFDTTPIDDANACHTADGGGTRPGRIGLPAEYCLRSTVMIHELAHAFIGGRYPTWFAEGVAEVVTYHLTGTRAGYLGGEGDIELEGRYFVLSPPYSNQAALGADFLEALYNLAGAEEMSAFIKDVAGRSTGGRALLNRIREMEVEDPQALEDLISDAFGVVLASP